MEYEIPLLLRPEAKNQWTLYYDWLKIAQLEIGSRVITPLREATFNKYTTMTDANLPVAKHGNQW